MLINDLLNAEMIDSKVYSLKMEYPGIDTLIVLYDESIFDIANPFGLY